MIASKAWDAPCRNVFLWRRLGPIRALDVNVSQCAGFIDIPLAARLNPMCHYLMFFRLKNQNLMVASNLHKWLARKPQEVTARPDSSAADMRDFAGGKVGWTSEMLYV
jgi:hypothetical protein